jgi:hypothetical protein
LYSGDQAVAGARKVWYGKDYETGFVQGLQRLGFSKGQAALIDLGVGLGLGAGAWKISANMALTTADFPAVAAKVSGKQARHIFGTQAYAARGSGGYLNSMDDAQAVLDAYQSGSAAVIGKSAQGFPIVEFNGVTGTNVNVAAGFPNQPTNIFMIKGTVRPSVVPMQPNWTPAGYGLAPPHFYLAPSVLSAPSKLQSWQK